KCYAVWS
uniref:Uncharacterized protein n=1 Tax=Strongyloides venezuelensis TaxID=75913 RepID=A0A1Y9EIR6_STRVS